LAVATGQIRYDEGQGAMTANAKTIVNQMVLTPTYDEAEDAQPVEIDLRGGGFEVVKARILTSPQLTDHNTPDRSDTVSPQTFDQLSQKGRSMPVDVPWHSFVTVALDLAEEAI
jgi:alpha-L-arabinofuranosidase